jgi:hypothetical protein
LKFSSCVFWDFLNFSLCLTLFDVVGLLGGDRLCGESLDILGDRFVMRLAGRSLVWEKCGYFRRSLFD